MRFLNRLLRMVIRLDVLGMENLPVSLSSQYKVDSNTRRIILNGNHSNVNLDFSLIEKFINKKLDSLQKDLLDVATTIYLADKFFVRDAIQRSRHIRLLIPV